MMNEWNTVSYIGVTGSFQKRVWQHKSKLIEGFTKRYNITKLVHFEIYDDPETAIAREKQLKKWSRKKKIALIKKTNPELRDLSADWGVGSLDSLRSLEMTLYDRRKTKKIYFIK